MTSVIAHCVSELCVKTW